MAQDLLYISLEEGKMIYKMLKSMLVILIVALSLCVCVWLKAEAEDTSDDNSQSDTAMAFKMSEDRAAVEIMRF